MGARLQRAMKGGFERSAIAEAALNPPSPLGIGKDAVRSEREAARLFAERGLLRVGQCKTVRLELFVVEVLALVVADPVIFIKAIPLFVAITE